MKEDVMAILDTLRPALKGAGGDLELVEITEDGTVTVRMKGLCSTCTAALWTHRLRIERAIKMKLPDVTVIVRI